MEYVFCDAFRGCSALRSVVWPASADGSAQALDVHAGAFRSCARLCSLDFPRDPTFVDRLVSKLSTEIWSPTPDYRYTENKKSRRLNGDEYFEQSKKETWRADLQNVSDSDDSILYSVFRGCDALLRAE